MMNLQHYLFFLFTLFFLQSNAQLMQISGVIVDDQTSQPLPFASLGFEHTSIGTVSNQNGFFQFQFPEALKDSTLLISFMGYESAEMTPSSASDTLTIRLKPTITELHEVVVRPLSPQQYIKRVVKNFPTALPLEPFGARSYYRELIRENKEYLSYTEGVFKSYYPAYQDTARNQHQLLLYRKEDHPKRIEFMRDKIDKEKRKEERKAERKGEEYKDPEIALAESTFGGPNAIFNLALSNHRIPGFMDSTKFKEYKYEFGESATFQNRELLNIRFEAKHQIEHQLSTGNIYIDLSTNAVILITLESKMDVPALMKPLLFLYGLNIDDFDRSIQTRYQYSNGRWYPEYFYYHLEAKLEKRHLFDDNEESHLEMEILIKINEIKHTDIAPIPEAMRFNALDKTAEQVHNDEEITWSEINTLTQ